MSFLEKKFTKDFNIFIKNNQLINLRNYLIKNEDIFNEILSNNNNFLKDYSDKIKLILYLL